MFFRIKNCIQEWKWVYLYILNIEYERNIGNKQP